MALFLEFYTFAQQYVNSWRYSAPTKDQQALRVGVLSTATINAASIIHPAETHPGVVLYGIASRNAETAEQYAKKYKFKKHYGSYDALLADPSIDFVYISLPNGLHYEWAVKSIKAGKHVLLEKPITNNAEDAKALVALAKEKNVVLMEAFHWQFHPAAQLFGEVMADPKRRGGNIISTYASMTATPAVPPGDIRWKYDLGGGGLMDMTYVLSFTRFALGQRASVPKEVVSAKATPSAQDERIDKSMKATLLFASDRNEGGSDVVSTIYTDLARDWMYGVIPRVWELPQIRVETEEKEIFFYNAMMPHIYHYISIKDKKTGQVETLSRYRGGGMWGNRGQDWWSTYRYQLEAFVDRLKGNEPAWWISGEESIDQMRTVDEVYKKAGLPIRPRCARNN